MLSVFRYFYEKSIDTLDSDVYLFYPKKVEKEVVLYTQNEVTGINTSDEKKRTYSTYLKWVSLKEYLFLCWCRTKVTTLGVNFLISFL